MGRSNENDGLVELSEKVSCAAARECRPEDLFKDYPSLLPSLEQPLLSSCFRNFREEVDEEEADEDFCPLRQANAELKAEQSSLLLKNSELLSQTLLLKLENQRLKQQLELQLQKKRLGASFSVSSSSLEEDSDNDEEVKLVSASSEDASITYDSS